MTLLEFLQYTTTHVGALFGLLLLIAVIYAAVTEIVKAVKTTRKIEAYRIGERWCITINGATRADIRAAIRTIQTGEPKAVMNIYEKERAEK